MKTQENAETPRTQRFTENRGRRARRARRVELTTPDLVLLSLLAERPMHGYQANLELERREIRDWANVSRPQVYYSHCSAGSRGFFACATAAQKVSSTQGS